MDRIDINIHTPSLEYDELRERPNAEASAAIRARVNLAREAQRRRYKGKNTGSNAYINSRQLEEFCSLSPDCEKLMRDAFLRLAMTARSYDRILRVARTIADLDGAGNIAPQHLAEAIQYRRQA